MHYAPDFVIPRGLSTLYWPLWPKGNHTMRHHWLGTGAITKLAAPNSDHINRRSQDQLLKFPTDFYNAISSEFLVRGNIKHIQFSQGHCSWSWDFNSQPLVPKASAVSIELCRCRVFPFIAWVVLLFSSVYFNWPTSQSRVTISSVTSLNLSFKCNVPTCML